MSCRCLSFLGLFFLIAVATSAAAQGGAGEPPPEALLATLPFADAPPTRVAVDLAPPGQKSFVLYLDTGASGSVVTTRMARSLGVRVRALKSTPYRRKTALGRDLQFWIDEPRSSGSRTGWEYGLLGGDFLDDYVVEIDYPGRRVRFFDPKKYRVPESADAPDERVLPITVSNTRLFTDLEFDGGTARVLLDTGAPNGVMLSGKSAKKLGIDVDGLEHWGEVGGVIGTTEARMHEADSITWAGFDFEKTPVIVLPRGFFNQGGNTDSTIGYDLLRQFVIRIDYKRKRLWLRRGQDRRMTLYGDDYELSKQLGASISQVAPIQFQVFNVVPGGAASSFGLLVGDLIVKQQGGAALSFEELARRILAGEPLTVARRHGEEGAWLSVEIPEPQHGDEPAPEGAKAPPPPGTNGSPAAEDGSTGR